MKGHSTHERTQNISQNQQQYTMSLHNNGPYTTMANVINESKMQKNILTILSTIQK